VIAVAAATRLDKAIQCHVLARISNPAGIMLQPRRRGLSLQHWRLGMCRVVQHTRACWSIAPVVLNRSVRPLRFCGRASPVSCPIAAIRLTEA
jgi:hypothetical protein